MLFSTYISLQSLITFKSASIFKRWFNIQSVFFMPSFIGRNRGIKAGGTVVLSVKMEHWERRADTGRLRGVDTLSRMLYAASKLFIDEWIWSLSELSQYINALQVCFFISTTCPEWKMQRILSAWWTLGTRTCGVVVGGWKSFLQRVDQTPKVTLMWPPLLQMCRWVRPSTEKRCI